jgi:hypothetical protein
VDAVLVSVHRLSARAGRGGEPSGREFPGIPTVALVSQHDPGVTEMLLRLGASGVRQVVDVTSPAGWNRLRLVVGQPPPARWRGSGSDPRALGDAPPDARLS